MWCARQRTLQRSLYCAFSLSRSLASPAALRHRLCFLCLALCRPCLLCFFFFFLLLRRLSLLLRPFFLADERSAWIACTTSAALGGSPAAPAKDTARAARAAEQGEQRGKRARAQQPGRQATAPLANAEHAAHTCCSRPARVARQRQRAAAAGASTAAAAAPPAPAAAPAAAARAPHAWRAVSPPPSPLLLRAAVGASCVELISCAALPAATARLRAATAARCCTSCCSCCCCWRGCTRVCSSSCCRRRVHMLPRRRHVLCCVCIARVALQRCGKVCERVCILPLVGARRSACRVGVRVVWVQLQGLVITAQRLPVIACPTRTTQRVYM